mmetsp:Transcript_14565/g.24860  ORF Transcript_14565/g.24860 Transcript_14565/m.24860 type:complete len:89 (+) Transcript_14565:1085-1351(+)
MSSSVSSKVSHNSKQSERDEGYLKQILSNVISLSGFQHLLPYYSEPLKQLSLFKVIRDLQKNFSIEQWDRIKKFHKREKNQGKMRSQG